ncbi:MAG: hypothetical protein O2887_13270 [Bacteroidetes bacterium]|nr:hypothetical protein [Bacteroidota bacterium]MDA1121441.1 hypothetical protein [Bacteroidota bacterium]
MTFQEFLQSVSNSQPPKTTQLLLALWYDKKGDWNKSHEIAQDIHTPEGSWIHAYLHRKEGDIWNADYWYRQAGQTRPSVSLDEEWEMIVKAFL